jgi:hypothetical protein
MNHRIREIAKDCGINVQDTLPGGWPNDQAVIVEEFARSIISECLAEVFDEVQYFSDFDKAEQVSNRVKEHFGIEE